MVSSADPTVSRSDFTAGDNHRGPLIPITRACNPHGRHWTNDMSNNINTDYKRLIQT